MKRVFTWVLIGGAAVMGLASCAKNTSPAGPFNAPVPPPSNFLFQWGSLGTGNGQFEFSEGIAVNSAGTTIYAVDLPTHRVEAFDGSGHFLFQWGTYGSGNGQFSYPTGIAVNSAGTTVYVADTDNNRVEAFSSTGAYLAQWGSYGSGNGQFQYGPEGLAVNSAGTTVYASSNSFPSQVQAFSPSGAYLTQWSTGPNFYNPYGIAVNSAGTSVYMTDTDTNGVDVYNSAGILLAQWVAHFPAGNTINLTGIALSPDNSRVYVVDPGNSRVVVFDSSGNSISQFGTFGVTAGYFNNPTFIAVDGAGCLYVSNAGNSCIEKFGP
jgi:DNA-binding beta-propeller fold protein YncE